MHKITLATLFHDPEARLAYLTKKYGAKITSLFIDCFVVSDLATESDGRSLEPLIKAGMTVVEKPEKHANEIGTGRRLALKAAVKDGVGEYIFYCDFDRLLHWIWRYPEELKRVLKNEVGKFDCTAVGRTERAFKTHPIEQREPEAATNEVIAKTVGLPKLDVTTGAFIFNWSTAVAILKTYKEKASLFSSLSITDTEWPMTAHLLGKTVGMIETEGLEFETPDAYRKEIAKLGYEEWLIQHFTEKEKAYRWSIANESIAAIEETRKRIAPVNKEKET